MATKKATQPIQLDSDKWYLVAHGGTPLLEECCDCGLVHLLTWKVENGKMFVNYKREEAQTKKARARRLRDAK